MAGLPDLKMSPKGLQTNSSALESAPGSLKEAVEVSIRRIGSAEPRPGFASNGTWASGDGTKTLISFDGDVLAIRPATAAAQWDNGSGVTDTYGSSPTYSTFTDHVTARKNLYLCAEKRILKLASGSATTAAWAGPPPTVHVASATVLNGSFNDVVQDGYQVAYRVVVRREDANGVISRSAPSNRYRLTNSAGAARDTTIIVTLHDQENTIGFVAGDVLEVYRTFEATTEPEEEYFLAREHTITSTNLSAGEVTLVDSTAEADFGLALYTNPNSEGAEATHLPPFAAECCELYNGSLWFGNITFPAQQIISVYEHGINASDSEVGAHQFTGDFTNGSDQITNVAPFTGTMAQFKVGQIIGSIAFINEWASATTQYARITAISGTTFTISQNYTGATGTKDRLAYDTLKIDSEYFPTGTAAVRAIRHLFQSGAGAGPASQTVTAEDVSDPDSVRRTILIRHSAVPTSFTIQATNGDQYDPPLPEITATATTVAAEEFEDGVIWSNAREPEHFTADNFEQIGDGAQVSRLKRSGNSILIFTNQGVFRASGHEESGIRFDDLDESVRLLYPAAIAALGKTVYAWADSGIYSCTEEGCDLISFGIADQLEPLQRAASASSASGLWAVENTKAREVLFSVPAVGALTSGAKMLVYNKTTGSWVHWLSGETLRAGAYHEGRLWIQGASNRTRVERTPEDGEYYTADRDYSVTISAVSGGTAVTISAGSGWTPAVGDLVIKSGAYFLVTAITDATHFTVHTTITTGAVTAYVAFTSVITPIASTAKNPGLLKTWGEGVIWWGSTYGVLGYTLRFTSALSQTNEDQTRTLRTNRNTDEVAESFRFVTPRRHSMTTRLYPSVRVTQAGSKWRLECVSVDYRYLGPRVRAQ